MNNFISTKRPQPGNLLARMADEQPNHPALIVLANDYQNAVEKAQGLVSVHILVRTGPNPRRAKNSFIHPKTFYKKIERVRLRPDPSN